MALNIIPLKVTWEITNKKTRTENELSFHLCQFWGPDASLNYISLIPVASRSERSGLLWPSISIKIETYEKCTNIHKLFLIKRLYWTQTMFSNKMTDIHILFQRFLYCFLLFDLFRCFKHEIWTIKSNTVVGQINFDPSGSAMEFFPSENLDSNRYFISSS